MGNSHVIFWVSDLMGICDGHPDVVWKYKKGQGGWMLQGEWNLVAVELAGLLAKILREKEEPIVQYELPIELPDPATPERIPDHARLIMLDFFTSRGMGMGQVAKILGISRGLWSDIITGRRPVSQNTWISFRRLYASS